jgi:hemerythrin superfamily protein
MNVINLLKKDHSALRSLINRYERTGRRSFDRKRELFGQLRYELECHTQAEEEVFYPALRSLGRKAHRLVADALKEHREVEELLLRVGRPGLSDEEFAEKVEILMDSLDHHLEEEEGEIFRFAQENCPPEQLEALSRQIDLRKRLLERELAA